MPVYTIKHLLGVITLSPWDRGWILELGDEEPGLYFGRTYLAAIRAAGFNPRDVISVSF